MLSNSKLTFFYVLDANYVHFLKMGLRLIRALHENSMVFAYDVGAKPSEELADIERSDSNFRHIDWGRSKWVTTPFIESVDFEHFNPNWSIRDQVKYYSRKLRSTILGSRKDEWITDKKAFVERQRGKMRIWAQKAVCARDCLSRVSDGVLIFLDADAMPWRSLASLDDENFDVALTLRRLDEVKVGFDHGFKMTTPLPYHAINAGVVVFRVNSAASRFIERWIVTQEKLDYFMLDQTALSKICLDADSEAFMQYRKPIFLDDGTLIVLLPCDEYNNTYMAEDFTFSSDCKVAHFKGYLHQKQYMAKLNEIITSRADRIRN